MIRHRRAVAGLALLVLSACAAPGTTTAATDQGTSTPSPTSAAPTLKTTAKPTSAVAKPSKLTAHKLGEVVNIGTDDGSIKVQMTVTKSRVSTHPTTDGYGDPPKHGLFHFVTVKIRNIGTKPYSYNPLYFELSDPDGNRTSSADGNSMFAGGDNDLGSGDLSAGDLIQGEMVFDAKPNATTLRLNDFGPSNATVAIWTIK